MTSPENAAFYRDVLGISADEAEHVDDVHPCLIPVTHDETDRIFKGPASTPPNGAPRSR